MMKLVREKPSKVPVVAAVKGWSDTHVLFDLTVGKGPVQRNMSRPIAAFMGDYGLETVRL